MSDVLAYLWMIAFVSSIVTLWYFAITDFRDRRKEKKEKDQ